MELKSGNSFKKHNTDLENLQISQKLNLIVNWFLSSIVHIPDHKS